MNSPDQAVMEHCTGAIEPMGPSVFDYARNKGVMMLAGLAMGAGVIGSTVRGFIGTDPTQAQTPAADVFHPEATSAASRSQQIEEYAHIITGSTTGKVAPNTFVIYEKCKDGSKQVDRKVVATKTIQALGKCNLGSSLKTIEQKPLSSEWVNKSASIQRIPKVTKNNNHRITYIEQEQAPSQTPAVIPPTAPAPAPTPPTQPVIPPPVTTPTGTFTAGQIGYDISWAQCSTPNEYPIGAQFGIVDVNDGLGFSTNPCLAQEASNFTGGNLSLYVNAAWNSASVHVDPSACPPGDENCLAYKYGYDAGTYAYGAAKALGVTSVTWMIDTEPSATWSTDTTQNQNSLQGEHDALVAEGATTVGVYSDTQFWHDITASWQNGWPSWGATTWTTSGGAATYCTGHEFTGGPSLLMQYTPTAMLDYDYACKNSTATS